MDSRKEKALGFIVTKFLEEYNRDDAGLITIDQAANRLGVEKPRIYEIVSLFEFLGVVEKSGKSQYVWKGFRALYRFLSELRDEGMKERSANVPVVPRENDEGTKKKCVPDLNIEVVTDEEEGEEESLNLTDHDDQETSTSSEPVNKKWKLAGNILKLFLCSDDGVILTIKDLTNALLNDESEDPPIKMKSKERSLYDPINVFLSINLIEKTYKPGTKKPAYRWIGPKLIAECSSSKKRAAEIQMSDLEAGSANESSEVIEAEPISMIYPPAYDNPENGWIMRNQSLQMDVDRLADALRSSQKDFGGK